MNKPIRFAAEWVLSDGPQDMDEFNPDLVEYEVKYFDTQKKASEYAKKMAANGPADDWWRVEEQHYVSHIYRGWDIGQYETVATWICDEFVSDSDL